VCAPGGEIYTEVGDQAVDDDVLDTVQLQLNMQVRIAPDISIMFRCNEIPGLRQHSGMKT
jgi:hypothetical protein